jgi:hypothetical protein
MTLRIFFFICPLAAAIASCKKELPPVSSTSSLTIVNAATTDPSLAVTFTSTPQPFYLYSNPIAYGSYAEFGNPAGPTPLIIVSSSDTTQPIFQETIDLKAGGAYSLYLAGNGQSKQADALLLPDTIPFHADSAFGVRFINLSQGSNPVSVNIRGNPDGSEVNSLSYKNITSFISYPATSKISSYTFEIRDAASGNFIANYTMNGVNNGAGSNNSTNAWRYRNFTIVLNGLPGGTGSDAQGTFLVKNY